MNIIPVPVFVFIDEIGYFYIDDENKSAIIDPGGEVEKFKDTAKKHNLTPMMILLTHGHFDHIGGAKELAAFYDIPIYVGKGGKSYTSDPNKNLSVMANTRIQFDNVIEKNDGDIIELGKNSKLQVIATPGHTLDGATYYDKANGVAFVGDTIFEGSHGRTDFPGGDEETLYKSIREKIFTMPEDTKLFSGHSRPTTVKVEKTRSFYNLS